MINICTYTILGRWPLVWHLVRVGWGKGQDGDPRTDPGRPAGHKNCLHLWNFGQVALLAPLLFEMHTAVWAIVLRKN